MNAVAWSLVATGLAAVLLAVADRGMSGADPRWLGASGGALLALAGLRLGVLRAGRRREHEIPAGEALLPRFFRERRRSPRHGVEIPVRLAINGHVREATLLSVSSSGALLRLHTRPGESPAAEIGQPVTIEDYPAGTVARVGTHGIYVDFAIAFDPAGR
jgi:hypothetical protein